MNNISCKIREFRISRNLKQSFVARKLNIHISTYCQIENGKIEITLDRFLKLLLVLNIDLKEVNLNEFIN
jgi:transcriptional regulator with XRE-family HTH domain